jgi:hypothetical protein
MINALLYLPHCCSYDTLIVALLSKCTTVLSRTTILINSIDTYLDDGDDDVDTMMRMMIMIIIILDTWNSVGSMH